jgi:hypothetical protein
MYRVEMQYIPGNSQIWVSHLKPEDPVYEYDTDYEAMEKAVSLMQNDETGRKYRVVTLSNT